MEIAKALDFVRTHHRAVLATMRSDGGVQLSLVVAGVDDDDKVVVSTRETAMKTSNLERLPRATLLVFTDSFYGQWVQIEGSTEIVHLPEAMEGLVSYYRSLSGEHQNWDEYRAAMVSERRVLVRMTVERAGPDRSG